MKKLCSILLVALLLLGAMPQMAAAEESEFKTLIDTYPYVTDSPAYYGELCIVVFEKEGVFYRAEADIPEDIESEIAAMEYNEDFDAQVLALLQDLPIKNVIVLSDCLLPEEALESLKGMTGQQLTDMGFVPTDEVTFGEADTTLVLAKNAFEYTVTFAEAVTPQRVPNLVEVMAPLTVKSAAFTVERQDIDANGVPASFVLHGKGWGHGVGLCQIGAAVMGEQGYTYDQILKYYYKGVEIQETLL